jgi:hypothetical protein
LQSTNKAKQISSLARRSFRKLLICKGLTPAAAKGHSLSCESILESKAHGSSAQALQTNTPQQLYIKTVSPMCAHEPYEVSNASEFLGSPTKLETCHFFLSNHRYDDQEMTLQRRKAREEIFSLMHVEHAQMLWLLILTMDWNNYS